MKFCERFNLNPFEYQLMPSKKIELWTMMTIIEDGIELNKSKNLGK
jgi:hypothetical protein